MTYILSNDDAHNIIAAFYGNHGAANQIQDTATQVKDFLTVQPHADPVITTALDDLADGSTVCVYYNPCTNCGRTLSRLSNIVRQIIAAIPDSTNTVRTDPLNFSLIPEYRNHCGCCCCNNH